MDADKLPFEKVENIDSIIVKPLCCPHLRMKSWFFEFSVDKIWYISNNLSEIFAFSQLPVLGKFFNGLSVCL